MGQLVHYQHLLLVQHHSTLDWSRLLLKKLIGVIEAAWSMGANTSIVVRKVLLPEAMPALVSGITVTAIALVGSTAIAGVIGAGGLGNLAYLTGFTRNQNDVILVSTVFILIIVFIIQFLGIGLQIKSINAKEKGIIF